MGTYGPMWTARIRATVQVCREVQRYQGSGVSKGGEGLMQPLQVGKPVVRCDNFRGDVGSGDVEVGDVKGASVNILSYTIDR